MTLRKRDWNFWKYLENCEIIVSEENLKMEKNLWKNIFLFPKMWRNVIRILFVIGVARFILLGFVYISEQKITEKNNGLVREKNKVGGRRYTFATLLCDDRFLEATSVLLYSLIHYAKTKYPVTVLALPKVSRGEWIPFYRPQTKFAKVMFLHLSVSHSVHEEGVVVVSQHALQVSRPTPKGEFEGSGWGGLQAHTQGGSWGLWLGGLLAHSWREVSRPTFGGPGPHPQGLYPSMHWGRHSPADSYCCRQYASCWNAFLYLFDKSNSTNFSYIWRQVLVHILVFFPKWSDFQPMRWIRRIGQNDPCTNRIQLQLTAKQVNWVQSLSLNFWKFYFVEFILLARGGEVEGKGRGKGREGVGPRSDVCGKGGSLLCDPSRDACDVPIPPNIMTDACENFVSGGKYEKNSHRQP